MILELLFIIQSVGLATSEIVASIAISTAAPVGLATGLYAHNNGLRFTPWFIAGFAAPGISFIPLRAQVNKKREQMQQEAIGYYLNNDDRLKLPDSLRDLGWSMDDVEQSVRMAETTSDALKMRPKTDEKDLDAQPPASPKLRFMEMPAEAFKVDLYEETAISQASDSANVSRFLDFLHGTWVYYDKKQHLLKKAFFQGEKFGLLSNHKQYNLPTEYVSFRLEGYLCRMSLSKGEWPVRVQSADIIFIKGERFVRFRPKNTFKA